MGVIFEMGRRLMRSTAVSGTWAKDGADRNSSPQATSKRIERIIVEKPRSELLLVAGINPSYSWALREQANHLLAANQ
jgi:hypothetical protein